MRRWTDLQTYILLSDGVVELVVVLLESLLTVDFAGQEVLQGLLFGEKDPESGRVFVLLLIIPLCSPSVGEAVFCEILKI